MYYYLWTRLYSITNQKTKPISQHGDLTRKERKLEDLRILQRRKPIIGRETQQMEGAHTQTERQYNTKRDALTKPV